MSNIWFTADFHLGHKNIIRYCNRPFETVEEMNHTILERLNACVKANDILYFLGDFCIGPKARAAELRDKFAARRYLHSPETTTKTRVSSFRNFPGLMISQKSCLTDNESCFVTMR